MTEFVLIFKNTRIITKVGKLRRPCLQYCSHKLNKFEIIQGAEETDVVGFQPKWDVWINFNFRLHQDPCF